MQTANRLFTLNTECFLNILHRFIPFLLPASHFFFPLYSLLIFIYFLCSFLFPFFVLSFSGKIHLYICYFLVFCFIFSLLRLFLVFSFLSYPTSPLSVTSHNLSVSFSFSLSLLFPFKQVETN